MYRPSIEKIFECDVCGHFAFLDENEVSYHLTDDGQSILYTLDLDHVAYSEDND